MGRGAADDLAGLVQFPADEFLSEDRKALSLLR